MNNDFNTLPWHDAELLHIHINRSDPGISDDVTLTVNWSNGDTSHVIFQDCYALKAQLNFGIIAQETIRSAISFDVSDQIDEIQNLWMKIGVDLKGLKHYQIETNSTNSQLLILARRLIVKNLEE